MANTVFPVIVVDEPDDVSTWNIYESADELLCFVDEFLDIIDGEFEAWDAACRQVDLVNAARQMSEGANKLQFTSSDTAQHSRLWERLAAAAGSCGVGPPDTEKESFISCARRVITAAEQQRLSRRPWWRRVLGRSSVR